MGEDSAISWTDHTFNVWWGCTHAPREPGSSETSPECDNCYAETTDHRYGGKHWGPDADRKFFGEDYWRKPLRWNAQAEAAGVRSRVFCSSMADIFEEHTNHPLDVVMASYRTALWRLIRDTPWLDWLLLTKRAERLADLLPWMRGSPYHLDSVTHRPYAEPWPNVWVGVTCGARSSLWRIDELRKIRAVKRFVSAEPLLEHITDKEWNHAMRRELVWDDGDVQRIPLANPIDWLIVGDESGHGRRPAQPDWIRTAREAAARHGVAFHFKQWAGADVAGITGVRKGPNGKIHLPILDGRKHDAIPT